MIFPHAELVFGVATHHQIQKSRHNTYKPLMNMFISSWPAASGVITPEFGLVLSQAYIEGSLVDKLQHLFPFQTNSPISSLGSSFEKHWDKDGYSHDIRYNK